MNSWFKRRWEHRMNAEFKFHLESQINDYISQGVSREEAELRARREFGAMELAKDECRDERRAEWLDQVWRDVRYALRSLKKSPAFAVAAVSTLALGVGANTAIFQLLDAVRLRDLPVKEPQQLAMIQLADRTGWRGSQYTAYPALTNPIWERFRDTQNVFTGVLAWGNAGFNLATGGEGRQARALFVSGEFFRVLGVQPLLGRVFTAADDHRGCGLPGAVISYSFWQRELGGDASAIGRRLTLNLNQVEIIGVTPAGFSGLEIGRSYDVAVPICSQQILWDEGNLLDQGTVWWLTVMGRLKADQSLEQATAQLRATTSAVFRATLPANYPAINVKDYLKFKLTAVPAGNGVSGLRDQYQDALLLLLATTGLVLLIACANLANLILARATAREHEFSVRLAIGASRGRLVRQVMTESVLLALGGAISGLFLAGALSRVLVALLSTEGSPLFLDLRPDWRMLAFTAAVAALTCILFGLAPALRATRSAAGDALKTSGRTLSISRERFGLRQMLVVSQVALSLVLLFSALLFSGSLRNLLTVDAGFKHDGILIAQIDFSRLKIPSGQRVAFKRDLIERIRAVPGVDSAAETRILPLSGASTSNAVWANGADANRKTECKFTWIGEGYLKTMGMGLLAGRGFNDQDTVSSLRVAVVNQSFARRLGLGDDPVGKIFRREATPSEPERAFEIIGLVRDTKYSSLREESLPIAFLSAAQDSEPDPFAQLVVRSTTSLGATTSGVRGVVAGRSPTIAVDFRAYEATVREGLLRERLMATLSGFFGAVAVLIAAIGLYGVMSYLVARRTNEIGLRVALGADRRDILALVLRHAGVLLAAGLAAGAVLALAAASAARSMLFGVKPYDPATLVLAAALLAAVIIAASYLPARRAARMDPMAALRRE